MATDDHQDWVDRVLERSTWEPSASFTNGVIVRAMASLPLSSPGLGLRERVLTSIAGIRESLPARLEGAVWVLGQYRELLGRS